MTDAERVLWRALREALPQLHWRHQVPFGPYIVDFCSHRARLIVEADGGQHGEPQQVEHDAERTRFLEGEGYRVLRFWNHDLLADTDSVLSVVADGLPPESRQ